MDKAKNNPVSNQLQSGVTEAQILSAIRKSGYPLQTIVAESLQTSFRVQEEWSYIDGDTEALRTIDVLAQRELRNSDQHVGLRVRPSLDLLIECKQSDLPYVFFLSSGRPYMNRFPLIAGLPKDSISVSTDDSQSTWTIPVLRALGLMTHSFITEEVICSMTFSKCVRKGSDIELSGAEAYQNLVLPLVKALEHFKAHHAPIRSAVYYDLHLALGIAIIDAPMIVVDARSNPPTLTLAPWIRIFRHESVEADHWIDRSRAYGLDVVHKDYFLDMVKNNIEPFAIKFAELSLKHHLEIATGKAFVPAMQEEGMKNIEQRLSPDRQS